MSHNGADSLLGKRKRKEAASIGDMSQARIDRYYASNASVQTPLRVDDHAVLAGSKAQTADLRCNSGGLSSEDRIAETSQPSKAGQQTSKQAAGRPVSNNLHRATSCAAGHEGADAHHPIDIQDAHCTKARPTKAGATLKATPKPFAAGVNRLRPMNAAQEPLSAGLTHPDLTKHLSVFLSALTERQQFRE